MAECENAYESCAVECVNLAPSLTVDLLFLQENFANICISYSQTFIISLRKERNMRLTDVSIDPFSSMY